MSIQVTVNKKQLDKQLADAAKYVNVEYERILKMVAKSLTEASPVKTGAYVESHSVKSNSSSRGRRKTSENKPRNQNVEEKRAIGLANLISDIDAISPEIGDRVTFRNDSTHARDVEFRHGHAVYTTVRNLYG